MKAFLNILICIILLGSLSFAEKLTGNVVNTTTNKPSAGDDVILIKLGQGMDEAGRTKSDSKGNFSLDVDDQGPHLVRVVHQGVTYHRMAPPGTTSVEVQVYDVAKKVQGVGVTADVMRFQAQGGELQCIRIFAVDNKSNPPRSQMDTPSLEFYLPEGAVVDSGDAQTAGGQQVNLAPIPQDEKNRYGFIFPLRPGQTIFEVAFHMPYNGELAIDPKPLYPAQHFVVMLPKTMQFTARPENLFKQDERPSDSLVQIAANTTAGQDLGFKIAGTGVLSDSNSSGGEQGEGGGAQAQGRDTRPGGGLGPPIDAPHPLGNYTWWILGIFAVAMAGGAIITAMRPGASASVPTGKIIDVAPAVPAKPAGGPTLLLQALKEEIFQLEMEHKQGSISQEEYAKAKAALDQTLERALKRGSGKS